MTHNWPGRLGAACVVLIGMMWLLPQSSYAATISTLNIFQQYGTPSCTTLSTGIGVAPVVSWEGQTEKSSDVVIESEGPGDFIVGHTVTVTFNTGDDLTSPVVSTGGTLPAADVLVCDPALAITAPVVNRSITILGVQVSISFTVTHADTSSDGGFPANDAYVVLRNLRWDMTPLPGPGSFLTASATDCTNSNVGCSGGTLNSLLVDTVPPDGDTFPGATTMNIAEAENTVASSFVCDFTNFPPGCNNSVGGGRGTGYGFGLQNSGGPLFHQTALGFAENTSFALPALPAFKAAVSSPANGDITTTATTVDFLAWNVPSGVTVTFPSSFLVDPLDGALNLGSPTSGPNGTCPSVTGANLDCVYTTAKQDIDSDDGAFAVGNGTQINTAGTAGPNTIVVTVGSTSGVGIANILATFGPDCTSGAVPRYTGFPIVFSHGAPVGWGKSAGANDCASGNHSTGCTSENDDCELAAAAGIFGRGILDDEFFQIVPTLTNMIVPWVTNSPAGWDTGIAISNTGLDNFNCPGAALGCAPTPTTVAAVGTSLAVGNTGPVTVAIFPQSGATPIVCTTGPGKTPGVGLNANGTLAPGQTWSVDLTGLLASTACTPSGSVPVEGYMVIQTGFLNGHAAVFDFTPAFGFADTPVIVLPSNAFRRSDFFLPEPQGFVAGRKH